MLQLQRASAGSGKTYTLAKKFIWFLITIKDSDGRIRLRSDREVSEGVSQILAITFTNKATNEMKQRITDKLAALAEIDAEKRPTTEMIRQTDYLEDFSKELSVGYEEIGRVSRVALTALLNQYSDFNVSTIDAFFQTVLRTFAYESNINDTYQLEIDSDYVAMAAIDATLDEINNRQKLQNVSSFWINLLMNDSSTHSTSFWNVFQKNTGRYAIYGKLKDSLKKMENEEFKKKRNDIDKYLDTEAGAGRLVSAYIAMRDGIESEVKEALEKVRESAKNLDRLLKANGLQGKVDYSSYLDGHIVKIGKARYDDKKQPFKPLALTSDKPLLKKKTRCADFEKINAVAAEMYSLYGEWRGLLDTEKWRLWKIYSPLLPYFGLLLESCKNITSFLEANNLVQIGETNSMLNRIIGDSDAPFVYERLGTLINHYLIDEFQDTSKMQWDNLRKLLHESDGRGEDNLIIGDAKQSIYRFRNAEPSLITSVVPQEFRGVRLLGMSEKENTNWRSDRWVVEFNNYFFLTLSEEVVKIQDKNYDGVSLTGDERRIDFSNLYSNVVQHSSHRDAAGYVEVRFVSKSAVEKGEKVDLRESGGEDEDAEEALALRSLGPLISSLLDRGYRQKDIALLVGANSLGNSVVDALMEYNSTLGAEQRKIEFISEESLYVSSSEAVGIIVGVLEKMKSGITRGRELKEHQDEKTPESNTEECSNRGGMVKWREIKCDFSFYALRHPEMSPHEQIAAFLREERAEDAIGRMLRGMQSVALPALVEAVVENFVSEDLRKNQAVYISAFQDLVIDYCSHYPSDVASFIDWWRTKGVAKSISSPEDTDAVQIMTIHKSKGLEFKCVILPYEAGKITPGNRKEWRWVRPSAIFDNYDLPKWVPVETTDALLGTEYADIYREYVDMYMMDRLNALYVAFTRAKSELYVFTKHVEKNDNSIGWYLKDLCSNIKEYMPEDRSNLIDCNLVSWSDDGMAVSIGEKKSPEREDDEKKAVDDKSMREERFIEEYGVNGSPSILHVADIGIAVGVEGDEYDNIDKETDATETQSPEAADQDPRSEGNLLHSIMERVKNAAELHRSVLYHQMRGLIDSTQAREWEPMLEEAMRSEEASVWFNGEWNVMNERSIIFPRGGNMRPDRILVSKDGRRAVVIDYKFGEAPQGDDDRQLKVYRKQVSGYVKAVERSMGIKDVEGYVWYVRSGLVSRVSASTVS